MSISQDIESRINIVDLVSRYVSLKKAGANYKALSPFTQEKTPSFMVSPAKNIAYCFSTRRGGGPIKFLMEVEGIEFKEALKILAKEAGVELKSTEFTERSGPDIYAIHRVAAQWYHEQLFMAENSRFLEYLTNRWLSLETIRTFQLGYAADSRDLWAHIKKTLSVTDQDLIDTGLFVSGYRDKFFGRITFPIANFLGHIVAFTARIIDQGEPKYLNSPTSHIFDKSKILYGYHLAKTDIARKKYALVVEGQMDTIALHQAGVTNSVGISGSALTKDHIRLLKRVTSKIYLCLDTDKAGTEATFTSLENLLNEDVDVRIIHVEWAKDPDEYLKQGRSFDDLIALSLSPIQFFLSEGSHRYDISTTVGKKQLIESIFPFLDKTTSDIERDAQVREIALSMQIDSAALRTEYAKNKRKSLQKTPRKEEEELGNAFSVGEELAGLILEKELFDLFLSKFQYTVDELDSDPSFALLKKVITDRERVLERQDIDRDRLMALRLHSETLYAESTTDRITKALHDGIQAVHGTLFRREKERSLSGIDPTSVEYIARRQEFLAKAKRLGITA